MKLSYLCLLPVSMSSLFLSWSQKTPRLGSGPVSCPQSSLPALYTWAALYVRTFSQGKLLEQLGHGVSRVDLHSQLCPCKGTGGDIVIQMLLGKGAVSHDRCLNNKTQLVLELSFEYTSYSCLKKQKTKSQQTVFRSTQDGVSKFYLGSPSECHYNLGKSAWSNSLFEDSKGNDRRNIGEDSNLKHHLIGSEFTIPFPLWYYIK